MMLLLISIIIILIDISASIFNNRIVSTTFLYNASWFYFFLTFIASTIGEAFATRMIKYITNIGILRSSIFLFCINLLSQIIIVNFCDHNSIFIFLFIIGICKYITFFILNKIAQLMPIFKLYAQSLAISPMLGALLLHIIDKKLFSILIIANTICIMLILFINTNNIILEEDTQVSLFNFVKHNKLLVIKYIILNCSDQIFSKFFQLTITKLLIYNFNISTYMFVIFLGKFAAYNLNISLINRHMTNIFLLINIILILSVPFLLKHYYILLIVLFIIGYIFNQDLFYLNQLQQINDKSFTIIFHQLKIFSIFLSVFIGSIIIKFSIYLVFLVISILLSVLIFV